MRMHSCKVFASVQTQENKTGRVSVVSDRGFSNGMWAGTVVMEILFSSLFPLPYCFFHWIAFIVQMGVAIKRGFLLLFFNVTLP